MDQGIIWVGNNQRGHFEVDGIRTDVPADADLDEVQKRLTGRTIIRVGEFDGDAYWLRLDDGQVVEFSGVWHNDSTAGTGIRFWNRPDLAGQLPD